MSGDFSKWGAPEGTPSNDPGQRGGGADSVENRDRAWIPAAGKRSADRQSGVNSEGFDAGYNAVVVEKPKPRPKNAKESGGGYGG